MNTLIWCKNLSLWSKLGLSVLYVAKSCKKSDIIAQSQNLPCCNRWFWVAHILPKSRFSPLKKPKSAFNFFFNHLHIRIASNHPYWPKAIRIWRWSEKNLRHFLVFLTAPIFVNKAYFFLFPISSTQQLPHFCFKPISVIHIWKAFNVYFLNSFVGTALFSKKCITFRWLNGK